MQGTRIPDVFRHKRDGWEKWDRMPGGDIVAPLGAYMKVLKEDGSLWCWYVRDPTGHVGTLWPNVHTFIEHEDGSLTVQPSILFTKAGNYHGFLVRGVWNPG